LWERISNTIYLIVGKDIEHDISDCGKGYIVIDERDKLDELKSCVFAFIILPVTRFGNI